MFYKKRIEEVFKDLNSSEIGLTQEEALERQKKYGLNQLTDKKKDGPLIIFFNQFKDILIIILLISAFVSAISSEIGSTIVILIVVILNAILGTIQTIKAEKSLESLKKLSIPKAKVYRNGTLKEINSNEITIGDIVQIEAGDIVSGDGRIILSSNLQINESALTGEVDSVEKNIYAIANDVVVGDQKNMAFQGSLVTNGTGKYIVTAIGMNTEIGKIATMLNEAKERKTPLQRSLDDFSKKLSFIIMAICLIVLLMNYFVAKETFLDSLMVAVALAVAAIPEALSSIVTIVLSISTQKMVKENAIIKNLNSVESLGCVSIICSDKTGTLTQNKMTPQKIYFYNQVHEITDLNSKKHDHNVLLKSCLLANNSVVTNDQRIGDPTELALIDLVNEYTKNDIHFKNTAVRRKEIPFDSDRKLMSVSSLNHIYTKGAPDVILQRCTKVLINGNEVELTDDIIEVIKEQNHNWAKDGLRVLGFAYKDNDKEEITIEDEYNLTFIGLVSLMDPPRVESKDAVKKCQLAGIKPIMITGDHIVTAKSIARQIGIYHDGDICLEGHKLNSMSEEELDKILPQISVYARVAPEHKIRIVKAWQKRGEIVAMTGDGVNDAPALKQSDIGVAMGITGTEVSKDAANVILTDDNFSTIVKSVITGRNVYRNISNSINYLLSGNFGAIICVLLCSFFLLPTPFLPVHLLFMNLIGDSLPAISIGMEESTDDVLKEKPRKSNESILNKNNVFKIGFEGVIIAIVTMVSYFIGYQESSILASTMAFSTICLSRLLHGFSSRSNQTLLKIGLFKNHYSVYSFLIGALLLHLILFVPFLNSFFEVEALSLINLFIVYGLSFLSMVIVQLSKLFIKK